MAQVILSQLRKAYVEKNGKVVTAVNDIDLTIQDGEFMVLVGPSGCGKSTTLRMIAGLEAITSGSISIDGAVVNRIAPKDRDIAMVFQNYALYPHMTVRENLAFGLKLRKMPGWEIAERVAEAAALLGLDSYLDRKPKALSGGQRQRVAVGRAIVRKPKVFLFDEPLSNLDAKMRVSTRAEIAKIHARLGATMVYVTHDQVEAMTMGTRICVMKDGDIMQVATPLELYNRPANLFVAGFIGSPAMNFFSGVVQSSGAGLVFCETNESRDGLRLGLSGPVAALAAPYLNQPILLGLRPENIHDAGRMNQEPDPALSATVRVEVAEPMGAETYLHLATGARSFVARVGPERVFAPGERVTVTFDLSRARLFDPTTGQAVN